MNNTDMEYFKNKLTAEKNHVLCTLDQMEKNETINSNSEMASELSFYDNHPSDLATELEDKEKGMAIKEHEVTIMKKINSALNNINNGSYGTCKICGKEIPRERLDFLPYADMCVTCQNENSALKQNELTNRPVEEKVLDSTLTKGYNEESTNDSVGFDAEDSYHEVQKNDYRRLISEFGDYDEQDYDYDTIEGYVEPIEKISNEQYKRTL
ncbi:MAG: TraR/DksA C4-type zinc finger protein [Bacillota bacterium]|nr:TraR/DksA C4-type zinc finger protein [Bacillota bacterium]